MSEEFDFNELSKLIAIEHNRIRAEPLSYIPYLEAHKAKFRGNIVKRDLLPPLKTVEGAAAVDEAIEFLKKQEPVDTLTFETRLTKAAEDHVLECGSRGIVSHDSIDGKNASERIEKYCEWEGSLAENLDFGNINVHDSIISMLIDDGIPNRNHRNIMFNPDFKYFGIFSGLHRDYGTMVAIEYAVNLRDLGMPYFDHNNIKYEFPEDLGKPKDKKFKSAFQLQDEDAPDDTVSIKLKELKKKSFGNKVKTTTQKYYSLANGTVKVIEIENLADYEKLYK